MSRISLSSWSLEGLTLARGTTFDELLPVLAGFGLSYVDILEYYNDFDPRPSLHDLNQRRKRATSYGIEFLTCWFRANSVRASRLQSHAEMVARLNEYLAVTAQMGCAYMTSHLGSPAPGMSEEEGREVLLRLFEAVVPTAEEYGVVIALEVAHAHAPYDSPRGALSLIREIDSEHLRLCPDWECWRRPSAYIPAKMYDARPMDRQVPLSLAAYEECLPWAPLVHAKMLEFDKSGDEPNIPVRELLTLLKSRGRSHDVTIEYEGWIPDLHPERDILEETEKAVRLVRQHFP
jgi:Xylose isomerase-like TIM barrel